MSTRDPRILWAGVAVGEFGANPKWRGVLWAVVSCCDVPDTCRRGQMCGDQLQWNKPDDLIEMFDNSEYPFETGGEAGTYDQVIVLLDDLKKHGWNTEGAVVQRDPRTLWVSADGRWAVIRGINLKREDGGYLVDVETPLSYGYTSVSEAMKHDPRLWKERIPQGQASLGSYESGWWPLKRHSNMGCYFMVYRDHLPWEKKTGGKYIPDFPKTCKLCNAPAYLGLNEVVHDPNFKQSSGCRGRVDA